MAAFKQHPRTFGRNVAIHRDHLRIRHVTYWLAFGLAMVTLGFSPLRYLFLTVPVLVLLAAVGDGSARLRDEAKPFLAMVLMGIALAPLNTKEGAKDLFLTFTGVSITFLLDYPKVTLWRIQIAVMVAFVFLYGLFGNLSHIRFDLANSESSFEGNFGYVFAIIVPFAVVRKRYWLALVAMALNVLALKRIAVLAAIAAVIFALLGEKWVKRILRPSVMLASNMGLIIFIILYSSGTFDSMIQDWTGQSANQFSQGRRELWAGPSKVIVSEPWKFIFGQGAGTVYTLTHFNVEMATKTLLHSDLLRMVYECGFIFFGFFVWLMYSSKDYLVRLGFLVLNIMFITDNTISYYYLIFYFVIVIQSTRDELDILPTRL